MTVKEMVEKLSQYPQDAEVFIDHIRLQQVESVIHSKKSDLVPAFVYIRMIVDM